MTKLVAALAVASAVLALTTVGCNSMGKKLEKEDCELFVKDVSEKKGKALLDFLVDEKICDGSSKKTLQLRKSDGDLEFRVVVKEGKDEDDEFVDGMKALGRKMSDEVFDGDDLTIHLCDDKMKTLKEVKPAKKEKEEEKKSEKGAGEDLRVPNSEVLLTRPAGWTKTKKGDWGVLGAPDKKAVLAFVAFSKPNESTARLGQVASVLGASNIAWQAPKPTKVGTFDAQAAVGGCKFGDKSGAMAYAIVDPGTPRKVMVVYALQDDASEATKAQAKAIVSSMRPAK